MLDTRTRVKEIRATNPCLSMLKIGKQVGISRERVRQILKSEKMRTKIPTKSKTYTCAVCGKKFSLSPSDIIRGCTGLCCSRQCRTKYCAITFICEVCGREFTCPQSEVLYHARNPNGPKRGRFCSKQCQGKWISQCKRKNNHEQTSIST